MVNNNTKICKHCKVVINKKAKRCPYCGGKQGLPGFVKFLIVLVVLIALVASCSNSIEKTVEENKNSYKDINGKTSFNLNETFQNKYEKVTMLETNTNFTDYSEYLAPTEGYKYIMTKFEVENINNENDELYVSSVSFNAYADGVAMDQTLVFSDKYNDLSATVGKDKKTIGYY